MSISRPLVIAALFISPAICCTAQSTSRQREHDQRASGANYFTPSAPSDILQRSLDEVRLTVGNVRSWTNGSEGLSATKRA